MEFEPMSPEDVTRTIHFLLQQEAQFAADLGNLSSKTDLVADGLIGLTGIVGRLAEQVGSLAEQVGGLAGQTSGLAGQLSELAEELKHSDARLGERIATVESHLDVVIEMFERHLREDHGHRPS